MIELRANLSIAVSVHDRLAGRDGIVERDCSVGHDLRLLRERIVEDDAIIRIEGCAEGRVFVYSNAITFFVATESTSSDWAVRIG